MYAEMAADPGLKDRETIKAVHVTDVHLDTNYAPGTLAECEGFLCCREDVGYPTDDSQSAAGVWGDTHGKCDLPQKTFESMMSYIVSDISPDMLIWTGDNSSHNIWSNTVEEVTHYTELVTNVIKDAVKDTNITIVPIHGNHDTWPVDEQDFGTPNSNYAISHIKEMWKDWVPADMMDKFGEYGYYSWELTDLKNGMKLPEGTRFIAYNTNACDSLNFNIWGEREDPGHQIAWLEQELMEVEAAGGLAIMIGHYTPTDCQHQWGTRFRALMERFQNVVRFGLTGHTHTEDYRIHHSMTNPDKPVGVTEVTASVTTYACSLPSFKVITFDKATMLPINMETYSSNMEEANTQQLDALEWGWVHDYLTTYNMTDLSPSSFRDLSLRIFSEEAVMQEFSSNRCVRNPHASSHHGDPLGLYCLTMSSEMHEKHECDQTGARSAYGKPFKLLSKKFAQASVDKIIGNWIDVSLNETAPLQ